MAYWLLVWRTFRRVRHHDCLGIASQAAFGAILSIVPAFICLVALTSTVGISDGSLGLVVSLLAALLPAGSQPVVDLTVRAALDHPAPGLLTSSLLLTFWSASGMLATYTKGLNLAWGVRSRFGVWRDRLVSLVLVAVLAIPIGTASVAVVFGRPISRYIVRSLQFGPAEAVLWGAARWTATFLVVIAVVTMVYLIAPSYRARPLNVLPGAVIATALWAFGSLAFNVFTSSGYARYRSYGGLTAAVMFLFWVQLSSVAFLVGAELNAELESMRRAYGEGRGIPLDDGGGPTTIPARPRILRESAP